MCIYTYIYIISIYSIYIYVYQFYKKGFKVHTIWVHGAFIISYVGKLPRFMISGLLLVVVILDQVLGSRVRL